MQKLRRPNRWKGTVQVLALAILLRAGYEVWYRIDQDTTWSMFARMASFPVLYLTALLLVGISLVFKWTGKGGQLVSPSMGFLMAVTLNAGLRSLDLLRLPDLCSPEKLFDFEFGEFRHALRDGIYGRICFPTWYHINRVPNDVVEKMEIAYRAELAKGCPEAADDTLFFRSVVVACAYWAINSRLNFIEDGWKEDNKWGISTQRQILLLWFDIFGQVSE